MNGGFRVRPDGQFVANSLNSGTAQKGIQEPGKTNEALGTGTQTNQSAGAFPLPSVSLPKGGGAIRGLGEKFAANPVTGTGSLNVPIFTSPGRSGFGPQLSLSYDSGSGNGPFGFGWSLSLPSITRKTDKGLPRYQDAIDSDVFILSGAEDLVPVFKKDQNEDWIHDAKGNMVFDEEPRDGYMVRRYRPRIEGLFARIERWTRIIDGDIHWLSISKDNILTVYGKDKRSRIADPSDASRTFSWLICQSYDDKGNAIIYEYNAEDDKGVDISQANEANRSRMVNRYLKRILYGNHQPLLLDVNKPSFRKLHTEQTDFSSADWMFEVVFDYNENHYKELPLDNSRSEAEQHRFVQASESAGSAWSGRPDPFSNYRAGFEVRTYRRCKRVLMFHRFPELGSDPYLVRSTEFDYSDLDYSQPVVVEMELEYKGSTHFASFIQSVTQSGYVRDETRPVSTMNGVKYLTYIRKSLPPLEFEYSKAVIQKEIKVIDARSLKNMPYGLDGSGYQWVDLDGEGLSGILTEQANAWFYKPNLGDGKFGHMERVASKPSLAALNSGSSQLLDLAGDGQLDVAQLGGSVSGFYERTEDQKWENFIPFTTLPNISWKDPNLRFVDLTGDGHADVMITENEVISWYPSLSEEGFGRGEKVYQSLDEEKGPRLLFADGTQSIYLSDMSGDGLSDLIRIRNGEVSYWPNLGYGHFGARVTMDNAPRFDSTEQFDQKRIRLADIDGSGTTDIIYLGSNGIAIYFNRSGNSYSNARVLTGLPHIDNLSSIQIADLFGNGTACLVWSSPLQGDSQRPMQYIDLMGGQKPHLMVSSKNNLGAETKVNYVASTRFYLDDKAKGKPWITRIPFPVHVVERVETNDGISGNRFVSSYAYHHGYFDGIEREFRGFGMVEQWDTEEFAALSASDTFPSATNIDEASHVPPVLTKTWFHTGAYFEGEKISRYFEEEYYSEGDLSMGETGLKKEQLKAMLLDDTLVPTDILTEEAREACRSLKGTILRQEIYALDGTEEEDRPYSVSERNYTIKHLQPRGINKHVVFFTHARETIDFHYERKLFKVAGNVLVGTNTPNAKNAADPRVTHNFTLAVDDYGNVLKSMAIGYGRRFKDPSLTQQDQDKQTNTQITLSENQYTNAVLDNDAYRAPLPCEARTFEVLKVTPPSAPTAVTALFRFDKLQELVEGDDFSQGNWDIPYEDVQHTQATDNHPYRRLIEHVRTLFRSNDLTNLLPLGELQSLALSGESYKLAFTPGLLTQVFGTRTNNTMFTEGGYVNSKGDTNWWIPSGRIFFHRDPAAAPSVELTEASKHFFFPCRLRDPFDQNTFVGYDSYDLLSLESEDPLKNKVTAGERDSSGAITPMIDYRVLQPYLVTDPNGNWSKVVFDALGMVAGTAVMGKVGENKGDLLTDDFKPDLYEAELLSHIDNPLSNPHDILKKATTRLIYDLFAYNRTQNNPQPQSAVVYTLVRETHDADLAAGQQTKIQHSFSYSDGFGREIQKKIQAEPGPLVEGGAMVNPRWLGSGWTIFNNKGKPVRQYEPYFSATHRFEFAKIVGVSPILFYDPVERVVATLHPNNTYEKVVFDPWQQKTYDVNDTIAGDPRTDTDISGYVGKYFKQQPGDWKTWLAQRGVDPLAPPPDTPGLDSEKKAAVRSLPHDNTPTTAFFDTLGRTFLTIAHNKFERGTNGAVAIIEEKHRTRVVFDIEGNQREVRDERKNDQSIPEERIVMRYDYDMLGNRIKQVSMEAGTRWLVNNVAGKTIRTWDSRGFQRRMTCDALQRPLELFVIDASGKTFLAEKTEYGESRPNPAMTNHRLKPWKVYDGAGVVESDSYDFKGNLILSKRQLLSDYKAQVDWTQNPQIENETFTNRMIMDALNRPIQIIAPHRAGTKLNVIQLVYNEANLLEREEVWLGQAAEPAGLLDQNTASQHAVKNINYNAKGQREFIEYGNGVTTTYKYDSLTFRLMHLQTMRGTGSLQDLFYTYDPAGNIISIRDDAQQTIYFNGQVVRPDADYTYDSVYRLINAHGREHIGNSSKPETSWNDEFRIGLAHPHDGQKMRNYFEFYTYDEVGNILLFDHKADSGNWNRTYKYNEDSLTETGRKSNRLSSTSVSGATASYKYDGHGNMTRMPHFANSADQPNMNWDSRDMLQMVDKGGGSKAYYVYDASGQRMRKVMEQNGTPMNERMYLGGFEIYRKYSAGDTLERETMHIMDDKQRIAMVETRTLDTAGNDQVPSQLIRYQFGNHLGSASLEMDDQAQIISYEEYTPYGSTSYQAARSQTETAKRYRYTGKERDEESGLYYYGARYYAPHLCRWIAVDPSGVKKSVNVYTYVNNRPISFVDPDGREETPAEEWSFSSSKPGFGESIIPIWGSVRSANYNFGKGNWGWGIAYTALAITDVFLVKSLVTAVGKGVIKIAGKEAVELTAKEIAPTAAKGILPAVAKEAASTVAKEVAPTVAKEVAPAVAKEVAPAVAKEVAPAVAKEVAPAAAKEVAPAAAKEVAPAAAKKAVALDANALINGLEKGELAAVDAAITGKIPTISITAAKEFLKKGNVQVLREFLAARGGYVGKAATAEQIAQLQAQAKVLGRVLRGKDAAVVGSAIKEGAVIITKDSKLLKFLNAAGIPARGY
jgi:RHS repeat-associated protein